MLLILLREEWVDEVGAGLVILGIMVAMALLIGKRAVEGGDVVEVDLVVILKMVAIKMTMVWLAGMQLYEAEVVVEAGEEEGGLEHKANGHPEWTVCMASKMPKCRIGFLVM